MAEINDWILSGGFIFVGLVVIYYALAATGLEEIVALLIGLAFSIIGMSGVWMALKSLGG